MKRIPLRARAMLHAGWLLLAGMAFTAQSQIPVGEWRLHLSYNAVKHVAIGADKVYAASDGGILVYHQNDQSLTTINKLNGLYSSGISSMAYDPITDQLIVGYTDGALDIIGDNTIANFTRLRDSEVTSARKINHISVDAAYAYLSTAYGVAVFDLRQLQIKETWRDLGSTGESRPVFGSAALRDSIYLATAEGVLAGRRGDNLLDFNKWERYGSAVFNGAVTAVTAFNGRVYAAGGDGLYRFTGAGWAVQRFPDGIQSLTASKENLFIISGSTIFAQDGSGAVRQITHALLGGPVVVRQDDTGNLWIGDLSSGLVSDRGGSFASYLPDGPTFNIAREVVFDNNKLFMVAGGYGPSGQPLNNPADVNVFEHGKWSVTSLTADDLTDVAVMNGNTFIASFGGGVIVEDGEGTRTVFDESNSPLTNMSPGVSRVAALAPSASGLWVANYGGTEALHLLRHDGSWQSFSFGYQNATHPTALSIDQEGNVWMALNPATGGGLVVYDPDEDQRTLKTTTTGGGSLPDAGVYALAADRDGHTWVGTGEGVAFFYSADDEAIKPIFENRFLLRDEMITAIAVDGGNRKWIGTEEGAWLFDPAGETLLHHFTTANSPLLSDHVLDIAIDPATGEVFFATAGGLASYRSDAAAAAGTFDSLRIFPNPVRPGYSGTVGITGLMEDAFVRITDASGRLVWQTRANGGMATWHLRSYDGRRAATGVYLVFATASDGSESVVGKIAVIE